MRLIVVFLVFLISACAASAPEQTVRYLMLPKEPWSGAPLRAVHQVTVEHADRIDLFEARIALDQGSMLLVLTDGLGRRGATIEWTPDGLSMRRADWFPQELSAERLLSDLVFAYWPEETLRRGMASDVVFQQNESGREVWGRDGSLLFSVTWPEGDRWQGLTRLQNLRQGYRMQIQSVRVGS